MDELQNSPNTNSRGWLSGFNHRHLRLDTSRGDFAGRPHWRPTAKEYPPCDLTETDAYVILRIQLPNTRRADIELTTTETTLTVSGRRIYATTPIAARYFRCERCAGKFQRTINLPGGIHIRGAEATLVDGLLTVSIPKAQATRLDPSTDP